MDFPNSSHCRFRGVCWAHHFRNLGQWSTVHVPRRPSIPCLPSVCSRGCEYCVNWVLVFDRHSPHYMVCSNMRSLLIKSRPQRMQQHDKLYVPRPLHRMPPHRVLTPLNLNCPYHLPYLLVPQGPPSFSSSFVISGRTHKLVFVSVPSSSPLAMMTNLLMFAPGLGMFLFLTFIVRVIVTPSLALLFVASMYSMFWLPQIIRSAQRGRPSALSAEYLIGTSICRLYFALCERFVW